MCHVNLNCERKIGINYEYLSKYLILILKLKYILLLYVSVKHI